MKTFACLPALCAALIALAGCGDKTKPEGSGSEAAAQGDAPALAAGEKPRAGQWQVKLALTDFAVPGMPDNLKDSIGKQMQQAGDVTTCLTQAEVDRNDGKFLGPRDQDCDYQTFTMADGRIAAKMTCTKNAIKQSVDMRGTYGPEAYDLTLDSQSDMNGTPMKMSMRVTGQRTGECTGKEKN
jgi:hypothetical protein